MSHQPSIRPTLSNLQLEFLKLYADGIPETDLKAIQRLIARYFADKASDEADKIWQEKGYTVEEILKQHSRTPYQAPNE
ncbi:MAG: hypothetical protein K9J37_21780 [Saprospiraceae bacterium]|nr:hypothetical protein [Saprospiraceae bacterium]MCF8252552.1 hypothetical protein [Saprospiraceae bacterium]MCF8282593.1 hypothetical protein [Bacteroidales bacterium]MCF8310799.1 hypothetical protein [Saprospiraceae bacterium]MCF8439371.1 hypothetical protein [Saprospiraceae bacterium]